MENEQVASQDMISSEPEKALSKEEINNLVKSAKIIGAEKRQKEMEIAHAQEMESLRAKLSQAPQENPADFEEKMWQRFNERAKLQEEAEAAEREKAHQAEYQQHMTKVAQQYATKMTAGKDKFSDFDEVMTDFDYDAFHPIAFLANELENTDEVMYELGKNPTKLAQLDYLAKTSPKTAQKEMKKLSESIQQNQKALASNATTNAPLSRLKSSNVGEDSGKLGLEDYKGQSWLRG